MKINIEIPDQRIKDLLCNALEGGSNYWYWIEGYRYPEGCDRSKVEYPHLDLPFMTGGSLIIKDIEGDEKPKTELNYAALRKGLSIMAKDHARHFGDFLAENDDATTGDVFLQCCLFREVIYG